VRVAALFGVPLKGDQAGHHSIRVNDQYRITLNEIVLGKRGITHDTALRLVAKLLKRRRNCGCGSTDWDLHEAL